MYLKHFLKSLPETNKKIVSVMSGGLDSTILTHLLVRKYSAVNVLGLSFYYGQKQELELDLARKTSNFLGIRHIELDLKILGNITKNVSANIQGTDLEMPTITEVLGDPAPKTEVPFRNMIINSIAFSYAQVNEASHVFTGLQSRDLYNYWDTTGLFITAMNHVAELNRKHKISLVAPFKDFTKAQEVELAKELGNVDFNLTLSCYNPYYGISCGVCPTCAERIKAFMDAGIVDPVPYLPNTTPKEWNK